MCDNRTKLKLRNHLSFSNIFWSNFTFRVRNLTNVHLCKGGLFSESFSLCLQPPQNAAKSRSWALFTQRKDPQDCDLAPFFGDCATVKSILKLTHLYYVLRIVHWACLQNSSFFFKVSQTVSLTIYQLILVKALGVAE